MLPTILDQLQALNVANPAPARAGAYDSVPTLQPASGSSVVLRYLAQHPGLTPLQLVEACGLSYETVHSCLRNATEKSWTSLRHVSTVRGKKRYAYSLTPAGLSIVKHNFPEDFPNAEA